MTKILTKILKFFCSKNFARDFALRIIYGFGLAMALSVSAHALRDNQESQSGSTDAGSSPSIMQEAQTMLDAHQYRDAVRMLFQEVTRDDSNPESWNLYGYALRKNGQYAQARQAYARALAIDPSHRGALSYMGELHVQAGELDKAREKLADLRRLCPQGCEEHTALQKALDAAQ